MTPEKWQKVVGNIRDNFDVEDSGAEELPDEEGGGKAEFIIFKSPLGRVKLEYYDQPIVVGKKTSYTNRIGAETKVDYILSETESAQRMVAFKWDDDAADWIEIDAKGLL